MSAGPELRPTPDGGLACTLPGAEVRFTGRLGGESTGAYASLNLGSWTPDDPAAVRANRDRLAALAGVSRDRLAQPRQVHGTDVLVVAGDVDLPGADLGSVREADGVATALHRTPCVVLCADCLPVALVADGAVATVHAGWRGLVAGVLEEGLRALRAAGGRGAVTAVVGPGAGPCCYEVGDEVHAALAPLGPTVRAGRNADLAEAARIRLLAAGTDRVVVAGICTICAPGRFFSHRRDAGDTGRQAGMTWST
ncbi:polyphenol oxidase family protein [Patulibacter minatonensis]|uniref:polyphenol oxidase family protein n=1 Tax=Patulibacter minatonensis TaxID=298163 RepID=UPI00047E5D01|nr:polyphenol oxidase family protein [Patulibacter minatonensis]